MHALPTAVVSGSAQICLGESTVIQAALGPMDSDLVRRRFAKRSGCESGDPNRSTYQQHDL